MGLNESLGDRQSQAEALSLVEAIEDVRGYLFWHPLTCIRYLDQRLPIAGLGMHGHCVLLARVPQRV